MDFVIIVLMLGPNFVQIQSLSFQFLGFDCTNYI